MKIQCVHLEDGGRCAINAFNTINATVSPGVCLSVCTEYDGPSRGLGDTVHKVIQAATLGKLKKPCGGCQKRRNTLNLKHSYSLDDNKSNLKR